MKLEEIERAIDRRISSANKPIRNVTAARAFAEMSVPRPTDENGLVEIFKNDWLKIARIKTTEGKTIVESIRAALIMRAEEYALGLIRDYNGVYALGEKYDLIKTFRERCEHSLKFYDENSWTRGQFAAHLRVSKCPIIWMGFTSIDTWAIKLTIDGKSIFFTGKFEQGKNVAYSCHANGEGKLRSPTYCDKTDDSFVRIDDRDPIFKAVVFLIK